MFGQPSRPIIITGCLALLLGLFTLELPILGQANSPSSSPTASPTPTITQRSGRRSIGGRRDPKECLLSSKKLTALVPKNAVSLTTAKYPSWFFYIPETSAKNAKFILRDESDREIYKTNVNIPNKPGVISLRIPTDSRYSALEVNKNYRWDFLLICNFPEGADDKSIYGYTQRIEQSTNLIAKLENARTRRDRVNVYANAGIWHETITILALLRRNNPRNSELAKDWENLLKQIELDEITEEPLL